MTDCWILYDRCDLEHNLFFARSLRDNGSRLGMDTEIVLTEDASSLPVPDLVISRCRDWELTKRIEEKGATVVNDPEVSRISNDKSETYRFVSNLGIPYLPYAFPEEELPPGPPWVVKSCLGHGGSEVRWADDAETVESLFDELVDRKPMVQSTAPVLGRDIRLYALGGKPIAAVDRTSGSDFRANFSLGGKASLLQDIPDGMLRISEKICEKLDPDFVGIDFLHGTDGEVYLNEIEDVVGTRMLYALTALDPARMLMEYAFHSKMSR
ncbi:MAG: hypothetical protein IJ856_05630 [Candidatus Methanomethylophilaceae archaeon]|nr:hypothetical protein [Candidatus Methanomethylophilaceae archaeon]